MIIYCFLFMCLEIGERYDIIYYFQRAFFNFSPFFFIVMWDFVTQPVVIFFLPQRHKEHKVSQRKSEIDKFFV